MNFHINPAGVASPCKAKAGKCPFGSDAPHFSTIEEATQAAEKSLASDHGAFKGVTKVAVNELAPLPENLKSGEHQLDDGRIVVMGGAGNVNFRSDCPRCEAQGKGAFAPAHDASSRCQSGGRDHCTCGACF